MTSKVNGNRGGESITARSGGQEGSMDVRTTTQAILGNALRQDRRAPYNRQSEDGYRHADRRTPQHHLPRPPSRAGDGMTGPLRVGAIGANPNRSWAKDSHIPALRVAART